MSAPERGVARAIATAAVVAALDQISKQVVLGSVSRGAKVTVLPGLELTNTRNKGVAFGALQGDGLLLAILIGASLVVLVGYFLLHAGMPWLWLPVGMLIGGALGNLADRARHGAVIDFIDPVAWPAFNVADASIVIGVVVLVYAVEAGRGKT